MYDDIIVVYEILRKKYIILLKFILPKLIFELNKKQIVFKKYI